MDPRHLWLVYGVDGTTVQIGADRCEVDIAGTLQFFTSIGTHEALSFAAAPGVWGSCALCHRETGDPIGAKVVTRSGEDEDPRKPRRRFTL